MDGRNSGWE
jgi:hypothetical protein